MKRRSSRILVCCGAVTLSIVCGFILPNSAGALQGVGHDTTTLLSRLFSLQQGDSADNDPPAAFYKQALDTVQREYYGGSITGKKANDLTVSAIRGMLYSLNDPFTSFLDPDEWQQMQQTTRGDFEGIGAVLEQYGQDVRVVRPIEDSPAFKAGVRARDVIVSVGQYSNGKRVKTIPTLGKNINDVVRWIKGPDGTTVDVSVMRQGHASPITFHLVRAHIEPPTVRYWMEDKQNKIGHILLNEFNEKSVAQYDHAYSALRQMGMRALVFDLRYNPGGLLNVAVDMGSRFIDHSPVVVIQEKNGQREGLPIRRSAPRNALPMVVLVNDSSASAAEIVAGAIKDNGVGTLVGTHTFGKGLVQTLFPLVDGSALRLTTAKYFTPKLVDISNKYDEDHRPIFGTGGIKPDVEVKQLDSFIDQDWTDANKKNDTQLQKGLEILRDRLGSGA